MKLPQASENVKRALLSLALLGIYFAFAYCMGNNVLLWVGLAAIPVGFCAWALSRLLQGPRDREIYANLTANEREQFTEMVTACSLKGALWSGMWHGLLFLSTSFALFVLVEDQACQVAGIFALLVVGMLISLPAMLKQRRVTRDFLIETEYARRMGYSLDRP